MALYWMKNGPNGLSCLVPVYQQLCEAELVTEGIMKKVALKDRHDLGCHGMLVCTSAFHIKSPKDPSAPSSLAIPRVR